MNSVLKPDPRSGNADSDYVFDRNAEYQCVWIDTTRGVQIMIEVSEDAVVVEALPTGQADGVPYGKFRVALP